MFGHKAYKVNVWEVIKLFYYLLLFIREGDIKIQSQNLQLHKIQAESILYLTEPSIQWEMEWWRLSFPRKVKQLTTHLHLVTTPEMHAYFHALLMPHNVVYEQR